MNVEDALTVIRDEEKSKERELKEKTGGDEKKKGETVKALIGTSERMTKPLGW